MARLHQTRVGYKQSRRLDKPGKKINPKKFEKSKASKKPKRKTINKTTANKFYETLKEKDQIVLRSLLRVIEKSPNLALEDICVKVRQELKQLDIPPTKPEILFNKAKKAGVIEVI